MFATLKPMKTEGIKYTQGRYLFSVELVMFIQTISFPDIAMKLQHSLSLLGMQLLKVLNSS